MSSRYDSTDIVLLRLKKLIKKLEGMHKVLVCEEISAGQMRVILPIIKDGTGYSMAELSAKTQTDKGLVSRTVAALEKNGMVARDKSDNEHKNYKIVLTPKCMDLVVKKFTELDKVTKNWVSGVSEDELNIFKDILARLTENE